MEEYEIPRETEVPSPYIDELLQALENAKKREEWGVTVRELSRHTGWSIQKVRERLGELNERGKLESRHVTRVDIAGRRAWVPAYKLK